MASRRVNNSSRDITRQLNQLIKKCNELRRLGVKTAVVYSPRNSGGLHVHGNPMITSVIEAHSNEILQDSRWNSNSCYDEHTTTVILPLLPSPLSTFFANEEYMKHFINTHMMKALKLSWKSDNPEWWPSDIPFQHVKTAPPGYQGNWSGGLRRIIKCCYRHYNLDPETYTSGNGGDDDEESGSDDEAENGNDDSDKEDGEPAPKKQRLA